MKKSTRPPIMIGMRTPLVCLGDWFGFGFGFSVSGSVRVLIKFKVRVRFDYRPCSLDGWCVRHKPATIMKVIATVIRLPYT